MSNTTKNKRVVESDSESESEGDEKPAPSESPKKRKEAEGNTEAGESDTPLAESAMKRRKV
jgi:hypothetical protein